MLFITFWDLDACRLRDLFPSNRVFECNHRCSREDFTCLRKVQTGRSVITPRALTHYDGMKMSLVPCVFVIYYFSKQVQHFLGGLIISHSLLSDAPTEGCYCHCRSLMQCDEMRALKPTLLHSLASFLCFFSSLVDVALREGKTV